MLSGYHEPLDAKIYLSDLPSAFLPASQGSVIVSRSCYSLFHPQACMCHSWSSHDVGWDPTGWCEYQPCQ